MNPHGIRSDLLGIWVDPSGFRSDLLGSDRIRVIPSRFRSDPSDSERIRSDPVGRGKVLLDPMLVESSNEADSSDIEVIEPPEEDDEAELGIHLL